MYLFCSAGVYTLTHNSFLLLDNEGMIVLVHTGLCDPPYYLTVTENCFIVAISSLSTSRWQKSYGTALQTIVMEHPELSDM